MLFSRSASRQEGAQLTALQAGSDVEPNGKSESFAISNPISNFVLTLHPRSATDGHRFERSGRVGRPQLITVTNRRGPRLSAEATSVRYQYVHALLISIQLTNNATDETRLFVAYIACK